MKYYELETTPVIYNASSVKILSNFVLEHNTCIFRMHWHDRMELLRIIEGEMVVNFGNSEVCAKAGELVIIPPHRPHTAYTKNSSVKYGVIMFDVRQFYNKTDASAKFLSPIFDKGLCFGSVTDNKDVIAAADFISQNTTSDIAMLEVMAGVYRLIYELYSNCITEPDPQTEFDEVVKDAINYIQNNYENELSTSDLSEVFGYTSSYFCRKFKENTSLTPMNFLKIHRLEKAYELIKDGYTDINKISQKCGFSDPNYFTRCFKAHFEHPPTYYVKKQT